MSREPGEDGPERTSPHILNAAANLLGFCLVVITSLRVTNQVEQRRIDELTAMVAIVLTVSAILSFASLRARRGEMSRRLEGVADTLFVVALVGLLFAILGITLTLL